MNKMQFPCNVALHIDSHPNLVNFIKLYIGISFFLHHHKVIGVPK
uniref:Uncharacterized protein n=1 Tax=Lepeophtheirus salmonis TaxID=72036 RepID=A0A0K2TUE3_LEPSM